MVLICQGRHCSTSVERPLRQQGCTGLRFGQRWASAALGQPVWRPPSDRVGRRPAPWL